MVLKKMKEHTKIKQCTRVPGTVPNWYGLYVPTWLNSIRQQRIVENLSSLLCTLFVPGTGRMNNCKQSIPSLLKSHREGTYFPCAF